MSFLVVELSFFSNVLDYIGANALMTAAVRTVFGCEPEQLNALFGLTYAQAGGGIMRLTLTDPGCAQENKIKVRNDMILLDMIILVDCRVDHNKYPNYLLKELAKKKFD